MGGDGGGGERVKYLDESERKIELSNIKMDDEGKIEMFGEE